MRWLDNKCKNTDIKIIAQAKFFSKKKKKKKRYFFFFFFLVCKSVEFPVPSLKCKVFMTGKNDTYI